jgi:hypothetical protein
MVKIDRYESRRPTLSHALLRDDARSAFVWAYNPFIAEHYAMRRKIADLPPMPPGYNISPGTFQPVVRLSEETGEREMSLMEWGLVPYWSKMHNLGCHHSTALHFGNCGRWC